MALSESPVNMLNYSAELFIKELFRPAVPAPVRTINPDQAADIALRLGRIRAMRALPGTDQTAAPELQLGDAMCLMLERYADELAAGNRCGPHWDDEQAEADWLAAAGTTTAWRAMRGEGMSA